MTAVAITATRGIPKIVIASELAMVVVVELLASLGMLFSELDGVALVLPGAPLFSLFPLPPPFSVLCFLAAELSA